MVMTCLDEGPSSEAFSATPAQSCQARDDPTQVSRRGRGAVAAAELHRRGPWGCRTDRASVVRDDVVIAWIGAGISPAGIASTIRVRPTVGLACVATATVGAGGAVVCRRETADAGGAGATARATQTLAVETRVAGVAIPPGSGEAAEPGQGGADPAVAACAGDQGAMSVGDAQE